MKKILNLCAVSLISLMVVSCGRQEVPSSELKPVEMENSTTQASQDSTSLNTSSSENSTLISSSEETSSESISSESSSVGPVLKEFPNELFISEFYNIRYNLSLAPEADNNDKSAGLS